MTAAFLAAPVTGTSRSSHANAPLPVGGLCGNFHLSKSDEVGREGRPKGLSGEAMKDVSAGAMRRRLLMATSAVAAAGWAGAAHADCSVGGLTNVVNGVTIVSASPVAASSGTPSYCDVIGQLNTTGEGAGPGMAGFELRLPANWNNKVLFWGVGGLAGSTYADFSANPVDLQESLPKGYATVITDEGHQGGNTDASFTLLNRQKGHPDNPARVDYEYRATHQVLVASKSLAAFFYGARVQRAYFDGCSNGGRQAMVEATRYPEDFDGIIAGAPFLDLQVITAAAARAKALNATSDSYLPATALPGIDAKVLAACDAIDGVADGLVQNPAACNVKPSDLGLTAGQTNFLATYISSLRDPQGRVIYPGFSITDFSNGGMDVWTVGLVPPTAPNTSEPWGNNGFSPAPVGFQFMDHILQDYYKLDPDYDYRSFPVTDKGVAQNGAIHAFDAKTGKADAAEPQMYRQFIRQGRKLIWYHGLSDPALPPFRDFVLYEQLAKQQGGYSALQDNVRFFGVPDMQHCIGGPGPNFFDTLTALETWVEQGQAPQALVAAHYPNNTPAPGVTPDRTMPLCPFPTQASYTSGNVKLATSWTCTPNTKMLDVGYDGTLAGLTPPKSSH